MDVRVAGWIGQHVTSVIAGRVRGVDRMPYERAVFAPTTYRHDDLELLRTRSYGGDRPALNQGERRSCRRRSIRRRQLGLPGYDALEHESLPDTCDCDTQAAWDLVAQLKSAYSLKMTTVALPVSGMDPPLKPEATATYCLPLTS
jgi:hypothetical protein